MSVDFDFGDDVVLITGVGGALGSAVARAFDDAGATVCSADVVAPESEEFALDPDRVDFYQGDFTEESEVKRVVDDVVADHGGLDALCNVAGTWRGGDPIHETDVDTFDFLFDVNLKTTFLASKHALPTSRSARARSSRSRPGRRSKAVRATGSTARRKPASACSPRPSQRRTRGRSGPTLSCRASSTPR